MMMLTITTHKSIPECINNYLDTRRKKYESYRDVRSTQLSYSFF